MKIAGDAAFVRFLHPTWWPAPPPPCRNGQDHRIRLDSTLLRVGRGPVIYHNRWNDTVSVAEIRWDQSYLQPHLLADLSG